MKKKKILYVGESSFLKTGYSQYSYELLSRLHATGKYKIAELGCFAEQNDPQQKELPWKFYGNKPNPRNPQEVEFFNSNPLHMYGSWKFEEVSLDFQPDIVFDIRDWHNCEFEERSPFRSYYHLCLMPPVDCVPQHPQWISTYMNADSILGYTDWGLDVLKKQSNGLIKTVCSTSPGVDSNQFAPVKDKKQHKLKLGLEADSFIVGTVMRNQKRKLFPDLMKAFRIFLDQSPKALAEKSYLYLHTSYPDWWPLPALMAEYEISNKCLFTYKCRKCNNVFVSHYQDAKAFCKMCGAPEVFMPNTHFGINRNELGQVINLFDIYVQYSKNEGFGIPIIEAASCGVPVIAVDYSAMAEVAKKVRGYLVETIDLPYEADTGSKIAIPNNQHLVETLLKFAQLPELWKNKKGFEARKATESHYNWDGVAKKWEKHLDSIEVKPFNEAWGSPLKVHEPAHPTPQHYAFSAEDFVQWAITYVAGRPELSNHYMAMQLIRDLQWCSTTEHMGGVHINEMSAMGVRTKRSDFTRDDALNKLRDIGNYKNFWEQRRWTKISQGK